MQLSALQIVLLVLVAAEINVDRRGLSLTHARPVIVGFLCGLILGDMNSGLYIGGTFTLMSLGVAALGGSSVPDYGVATIIACAFAKTTGQGPEVGMTIGLPVGMLGVQMDVLYKICNSFIAQKSQKYANEKQFGKMYAILYLCPVMVAVFMAFPTAVALTAGAPLVQAILDVLPSWVTGGHAPGTAHRHLQPDGPHPHAAGRNLLLPLRTAGHARATARTAPGGSAPRLFQPENLLLPPSGPGLGAALPKLCGRRAQRAGSAGSGGRINSRRRFFSSCPRKRSGQA